MRLVNAEIDRVVWKIIRIYWETDTIEVVLIGFIMTDKKEDQKNEKKDWRI